MVRIHPDPPTDTRPGEKAGAIAQLGERLLCKQEVIGSIPIGSTSSPEGNAKSRRVFLDARFRDAFLRIGCSLTTWKK